MFSSSRLKFRWMRGADEYLIIFFWWDLERLRLSWKLTEDEIRMVERLQVKKYYRVRILLKNLIDMSVLCMARLFYFFFKLNCQNHHHQNHHLQCDHLSPSLSVGSPIPFSTFFCCLLKAQTVSPSASQAIKFYINKLRACVRFSPLPFSLQKLAFIVFPYFFFCSKTISCFHSVRSIISGELGFNCQPSKTSCYKKKAERTRRFRLHRLDIATKSDLCSIRAVKVFSSLTSQYLCGFLS